MKFTRTLTKEMYNAHQKWLKDNTKGKRLSLNNKHDLKGMDLTHANLAEADLCRTDLTGVNLILANLTGANLNNSILTGATLRCANFTGAALNWADLTDTDLTKVNLRDARFHQAKLTGAHTFLKKQVDMKGLQNNLYA